EAQFSATFEQLAPRTLAWLAPELGEVEGRFNGALTIAPSTDRRALGPLAMQLAIDPEGGQFRTISIGPTRITAFADLTSAETFRFVTEAAPLALAGGEVRPLQRLTRPPDRGINQLFTADLVGLDLNALTRAFDDNPEGRGLVGRLNGNIRAFGHAQTLGEVSAHARLDVEQSDLAEFGPLA